MVRVKHNRDTAIERVLRHCGRARDWSREKKKRVPGIGRIETTMDENRSLRNTRHRQWWSYAFDDGKFVVSAVRDNSAIGSVAKSPGGVKVVPQYRGPYHNTRRHIFYTEYNVTFPIRSRVHSASDTVGGVRQSKKTRTPTKQTDVHQIPVFRFILVLFVFIFFFPSGKTKHFSQKKKKNHTDIQHTHRHTHTHAYNTSKPDARPMWG